MPGAGLRCAASRQPPGIGEHVWEVLAEAGYSDGEIADLLASGVVRRARGGHERAA